MEKRVDKDMTHLDEKQCVPLAVHGAAQLVGRAAEKGPSESATNFNAALAAIAAFECRRMLVARRP